MADGEDVLGALPTGSGRVQWRTHHMEDIKEATLEGSQFEAQFPREKTPIAPLLGPIQSETSSVLSTPKSSRPNSEQVSSHSARSNGQKNMSSGSKTARPYSEQVTNGQKNTRPKSDRSAIQLSQSRPKTTLRRTTSEKSVKSLADSDGSSFVNASRKNSPEQKPGIKRNGFVQTADPTGPKQNFSTEPSEPRSGRVQMIKIEDNHNMKSILKNGLGEPATPNGSVVQKKGKVSEYGMGSSTTLSSQAPTDASDEPEDHINVVLRVRPLNSSENTRKDTFSCTFPGQGKIELDNNGSVRQFGYNVVFEPDATQEDLFDHSGVKKLIDMALNGYACTALAFGQTGSGKTHTMTGPPQQFQEGKQVDPENYGIIQRSLKYLFRQLNQQQGNKIVRASYLEIYNEQVIDLLNPNMRRYLQVRWSKNKGFYVENLFVMECETEDDLMAVLEEGMRNRQTGSHGLNEFSSRSHSMLMLTIDSEQQDPEDENLYITKRGKLTFVDLAGSEKVKDSNSTADTLVESNSINKSLLVLGNCISSLGDSKRRQGHIPYRDSKLTKLLADSLGGNGVTLMICCITPSSHHSYETMNTLRYASRAKKIRTKPVVKMDPREKLILSLKREIKVLRNENHYLRQQKGVPNKLEFPAKPRGQLQKENDQKFLKLMKETNEKMKQNGASAEEAGLYEMLQEYMVENESLRTENAEMQVHKDKNKQEQQLLYRENERLARRIDELERRMNQQQTGWQNMPRQGSNELVRSRDHSPPRGSPQYARAGGSGGKPTPGRLPGYASPTANGGKGKGQGRGQGPLKPPHRLAEPIGQQRPVHEQGGLPYMNGHPPPVGYQAHPGGSPGQYPARQTHIGSPNRPTDIRMDSRRSSQSSSSEKKTTESSPSQDAIRDMNERLKNELIQLEGEIQHHTIVNHHSRNIYGSQGSIR